MHPPYSANPLAGRPQIDYSGNNGTVAAFPTNTPLALVPSYIYTYDSTGAPTTLPVDDACEVRLQSRQIRRAALDRFSWVDWESGARV